MGLRTYGTWTVVLEGTVFLAAMSHLQVEASTVNTSHVSSALNCRDGLILPAWLPLDNLSGGDQFARGIIYFLALFYMFVGVSIIADKFMAAIEVITSKEKEVTIKTPSGEKQTISVRVWNETVSNLTLMALGSSAPEILLSIIEIYAQNFEAGDLGPGTIVGSAAFNMFVIIAICVYSIPSPDVRKIKHLRVFFVTMTWSVFAYIWLYAILTWSSYGVIDVWEGVVTFMFFPATVLTAYIADRRLLLYKYLSKKYRVNKHGMIVGGEGEDVEMGSMKGSTLVMDGGIVTPFTKDDFKTLEEDSLTPEAKAFEQHRKEYISILRELRRKCPDATMEDLEAMAREEIIDRGPKSRAYYRIQATRRLMGAGNLMRRRLSHVELQKRRASSRTNSLVDEQHPNEAVRIYFEPGHVTVMESVGEFAVNVVRDAKDISTSICVDYNTEDGTANAGSDYIPVEGTLVFRPGEIQKQIFIKVIDDDVFEEDEHFYVKLSNPRYLGDPKAMNGSPGLTPDGTKSPPPIKLDTPSICTVMILDDDHAGVFNLGETQVEISESVGEYKIVINRSSGARGRVVVPYKTIEVSAKDGQDFEHCDGEIIFDNNETSKEVSLFIIDNETYEKDAMLIFQLGEPKLEQELRESSYRTELPELDEDWWLYGKDNTPLVKLVESLLSDLIKEQEAKENGQNIQSPSSDISKEEVIAQLGKPKLGENYKCHIRIKESKEFKNTVDKLFQKANTSFIIGSSSWIDQFKEAITVVAASSSESSGYNAVSTKEPKDDDDEEGEVKLPSCSDYVVHCLTVFWKVLFALVPPPDIWGGWACFITSILLIGVLTAFVGDLASHFGCTIRLKDSVTAISFVALGTSIPDTFASKVAAINDKYADGSIGNVTGSNAVNVFLGIGLAWSMAAIYHWYNGTVFQVHPGNLAFSVTIFCCCAAVCCAILLLRRSNTVGGELGGPYKYKLITTIFFVGLWIFYVIMCSLEAYGIIEGF